MPAALFALLQPNMEILSNRTMTPKTLLLDVLLFEVYTCLKFYWSWCPRIQKKSAVVQLLPTCSVIHVLHPSLLNQSQSFRSGLLPGFPCLYFCKQRWTHVTWRAGPSRSIPELSCSRQKQIRIYLAFSTTRIGRYNGKFRTVGIKVSSDKEKTRCCFHHKESGECTQSF